MGGYLPWNGWPESVEYAVMGPSKLKTVRMLRAACIKCDARQLTGFRFEITDTVRLYGVEFASFLDCSTRLPRASEPVAEYVL